MRANVEHLMQGELGRMAGLGRPVCAPKPERGLQTVGPGGRCCWMPALAFLVVRPGEAFGGLRMIASLAGDDRRGALWGVLSADRRRPRNRSRSGSIVWRSPAAWASPMTTKSNPGAEIQGGQALRTGTVVPAFQASRIGWHGTLEGHRFNLYEAHLEERRGSGKNRRWVTVFSRGDHFQMGFGRPFRSTTAAATCGASTRKKGWLGLGGAADTVSFDGSPARPWSIRCTPAFAEKIRPVQ